VAGRRILDLEKIRAALNVNCRVQRTSF